MTQRKTIRQALATFLNDNIATLVAVYDHENVNFAGLSPVAMVHSDGTAPETMTSNNTSARRYGYIISLLWKRSDDDNTEDYLDDLSDEVMNQIEANRQTNDWTLLTLDPSFSEMDYPLVDKVLYRRERIRVLVDYKP